MDYIMVTHIDKRSSSFLFSVLGLNSEPLARHAFDHLSHAPNLSVFSLFLRQSLTLLSGPA
jgi:hypothetical protein